MKLMNRASCILIKFNLTDKKWYKKPVIYFIINKSIFQQARQMKTFTSMVALSAIASYANSSYNDYYKYKYEPCQNLFFFQSEKYPDGDCGMPEYEDILAENKTVF